VSEPGWRQRPVKVKFTCANRENGPHKGETYLSSTEHGDGKPRLEWRGLCSEHLSQLLPATKKIKDEIIKGAQLLFSQEDEQGRVPILYDVCKHKRAAPRQTSLSYFHAGKVSGVCQECRNNPPALAERLAELARQSEASNGNGQKNAGVKKRGPAKGFNAKVTEEKVREAFKQLGRYAPQEKVSEFIDVDPRTFRRWLEKREQSYPDAQKEFAEPDRVSV